MAGINRVIIIGRLGQDPETKTFQDGSAVCNFSDEQIRYFWSKVDIKDSINDCWNWIGATASNGYGNVRINGLYFKAHRVAWTIANFDIPKGYQVMHLCDNPSCCNPNHLVIGTVVNNFCDMLIKNRQQFTKNKAVGARNNNAKLTDRIVREIRSEYPKKNQYELADIYGVTQTTIGNILLNKTWRHVQ
jgi:hypothetical protein